MNTSEKIILSYYQAFNSKNYEQLLSLLSDDVVHDINQMGQVIGKRAFERFLSEMHEYYDESLSNIEIMSNNSGDRIAAEFLCSGIYKKTAQGLPPASGQTYKLKVGCFFEIKNGKISRVTNYYNVSDWLRQVT